MYSYMETLNGERGGGGLCKIHNHCDFELSCGPSGGHKHPNVQVF